MQKLNVLHVSSKSFYYVDRELLRNNVAYDNQYDEKHCFYTIASHRFRNYTIIYKNNFSKKKVSLKTYAA